MHSATFDEECEGKRARLELLRSRGETQQASYLPVGPKVKLGAFAASLFALRTYFIWFVILFLVMILPLVGLKKIDDPRIGSIAFDVLVYFPILPAIARWWGLVSGK